MRRIVLASLGVVVLGLSSTARAQQNVNVADPFFLYYSYYIPRQLSFEAQASMGPTAQVLAQDQYRQQMTLRERAGTASNLFGGFVDTLDDMDSADMSRGYSIQRERERRIMMRRGIGGVNTTNQTGRGPARYHSGHVARFYPKSRRGYGPNQNIARVRQRGTPLGGSGVPSAPGAGMM